jgi:tetratricopeptide (TPR) repeat protein
MAAIQMEMGNMESAKNIYEKLIALSPNEGFSKYMCLGQLSTGTEAINFYKKGLELMTSEYEKQQQQSSKSVSLPSTSKAASNLEDGDDDEKGKVTKSDISTAYGSIAEIYLTDLWYIKFERNQI